MRKCPKCDLIYSSWAIDPCVVCKSTLEWIYFDDEPETDPYAPDDIDLCDIDMTANDYK